MPSTMQHTMVRNRASSVASWGSGMELLMAITAPMSLEARPVTVMQPAIMPAMEQATATVMQPRPPASSELKIILSLLTNTSPASFQPVLPASWLSDMAAGKDTKMVRMMAMDAENCRERMLAVTSHISSARGIKRYT